MSSASGVQFRTRVPMYLPPERCDCHVNDPPPWTGEIHGLSQALLSETAPLRAFWWLVMVICVVSGGTTTVLVVLEYIDGPTATSTTIKLVDSLELPAITICPKVPDAFNSTAIMADVKGTLPMISDEVALDLIRFFIAGSGLENMDNVQDFNRSYVYQLSTYYKTWSEGFTHMQFFNQIHEKYGYKCTDLFHECYLAGKVYDCCNGLFRRKITMRRGVCYTTMRGVNQTEADDIGRLILSLKAPTSITSPEYGYKQPQIVAYVTDNYDTTVDFPRFYLYPNEWNRMRFTARYIELIQSSDVCTNAHFGKDAACLIRKWLNSNIVFPFNCTLPYMYDFPGIPANMTICDPEVIVDSYYNNIELVWNAADVFEECMPGCKRWDYQTSLQQSQTLDPFEGYTFNLETSFNDLQYEYVKEVYTTTVPGFMSQIGGQFGFFLGLSIITFIQMTLYGIHFIITKISAHLKHVYVQTRSALTFSKADESIESVSENVEAITSDSWTLGHRSI